MWHRDAAFFSRVLELFVAAFLCNFKPPGVLDALYDLSTIHVYNIHTILNQVNKKVCISVYIFIPPPDTPAGGFFVGICHVETNDCRRRTGGGGGRLRRL